MTSIDALTLFLDENDDMRRIIHERTTTDLEVGGVKLGKDVLTTPSTWKPDLHSIKEFCALFDTSMNEDAPEWARLTFIPARTLLVCYDIYEDLTSRDMVMPLEDEAWRMATLPVYSVCNATSLLMKCYDAKTDKPAHGIDIYFVQALRRCMMKLESTPHLSSPLVDWPDFDVVKPLCRSAFAQIVHKVASYHGMASMAKLTKELLVQERLLCKPILPSFMFSILAFLDDLLEKGHTVGGELREHAVTGVSKLFHDIQSLTSQPPHVRFYLVTDCIIPILNHVRETSKTYVIAKLLPTLYSLSTEFIHIVPLQAMVSYFQALLRLPPPPNDKSEDAIAYTRGLTESCAFFLAFGWSEQHFLRGMQSSHLDLALCWHRAFTIILDQIDGSSLMSFEETSSSWKPITSFLSQFCKYASYNMQVPAAFARLVMMTCRTLSCTEGLQHKAERLLTLFLWTIVRHKEGDEFEEILFDCLVAFERSMPSDYERAFTEGRARVFAHRLASEDMTLQDKFDNILGGMQALSVFGSTYYCNCVSGGGGGGSKSSPNRLSELLQINWMNMITQEDKDAAEEAFRLFVSEEEQAKKDLEERRKRLSDQKRKKKQRVEERRKERKEARELADAEERVRREHQEAEALQNEATNKIRNAIRIARVQLSNGSSTAEEAMARVKKSVTLHHRACHPDVLQEKDAFLRYELEPRLKAESKETLVSIGVSPLVLTDEEAAHVASILCKVEIDDLDQLSMSEKEYKEKLKKLKKKEKKEQRKKEAQEQKDRAIQERLLLHNAGDLTTCPITMQGMTDPVVAADGHTYERSAIVDWMSRHKVSPITGTPFLHTNLSTDVAMQSATTLVV